MQVFTSENAPVISLRGVQPLIDKIKEYLGAISLNPERFEDGLFSDASQQLLWKLAVLGCQLHRSLLNFQKLANHPVLKENRLQIVTTNVASFLPLEYIYDRQAPSLDPPAPLCENAEEALSRCQ
jgi:hypothetical protein